MKPIINMFIACSITAWVCYHTNKVHTINLQYEVDQIGQAQLNDGWYIKSELADSLYGSVPAELRGDLFRPSGPEQLRHEDGRTFTADNVELNYAIANWSQLSDLDNLDNDDLAQVRFYGFAPINEQKLLDFVLTPADEPKLGGLRNALRAGEVFRSCDTELAIKGASFPGAYLLFVLEFQFKDNRKPIIVGCNSANYILGACYGGSTQKFYAPRFTIILDDLVKEHVNPDGLGEKVIANLQGRHYFD